MVVAVSFPVIHFTSRLMLFDLCCEAQAWLGAGPGSGEPSPSMSPAVRTALTLGFWGCCTAFAVAGYELGFIFAVNQTPFRTAPLLASLSKENCVQSCSSQQLLDLDLRLPWAAASHPG